MDCKIITDFSGIADLEADWKRLWNAATRPEIFNSFEYVGAWWSVQNASHRVFTPVVKEGPRVIAILPLVLRDGVLHFFCHTDSDFSDMLCEASRAAEATGLIFSELRKYCAEWKLAVLNNIPEHSAFLRAVRAKSDWPLNASTRAQYICPTLDLRVHAGGSDRLSGVKRNKQNERKLHRYGEVTFHHLEEREAARAGLQRFFQQHSNRRAIEGPGGQFISHSSRKLYEALIEKLDLTKELRFSVLCAGDKDIAYHFGFQTPGRMIFFKPAFDVDFWAYSPGKVLLHKLLTYAIDNDLDEFDFTIGDEVYKRKFANRIDTNYRIILTNSRPVSRVKRLQYLMEVSLRDALGSRLLSVLRSFLDAVLGSLRQRVPLNRFLSSTTATQYVFHPEGGHRLAVKELVLAGLSWLAEQSLSSDCFMPASELQSARELMKEGQRFFYQRTASGLSGGWLRSTDTALIFSGVRATSRESLEDFLETAQAISQQENRDVVVSLWR